MYRVIRSFVDLSCFHAYTEGDLFPFDGAEIATERIEELSSFRNRLGVPLIEEIAEKPKRTRKKKDEE